MCIIYLNLCRCCRKNLHKNTTLNVICHSSKRIEENHELIIENEQNFFCVDCEFEIKWYMDTVGFKKVKNYHLYNVPVKAHDEINNGKSGLKVYYKDCATHFWEGGDCDSFFNKNVDD